VERVSETCNPLRELFVHTRKTTMDISPLPGSVLTLLHPLATGATMLQWP
jgi:hypothetical protein